MRVLLTSVGDEVGVEAGGLEERSNCIDVTFLVAVGVTLGVRGAGGDAPRVVVGNVSGQTTHSGGRRGVLVDVGEESSGGLDVSGPAKPASVSFRQQVSDCPSHRTPYEVFVGKKTYQRRGTWPRWAS